MSVKNTHQNKKLRRLERALRKGRLTTKFNLIDWLKDYGHAQTKGAAVKLIEEDRVVSDSHPLGHRIITLPSKTKENPEGSGEKVRIFDPYVSTDMRKSVHVIPN